MPPYPILSIYPILKTPFLGVLFPQDLATISFLLSTDKTLEVAVLLFQWQIFIFIFNSMYYTWAFQAPHHWGNSLQSHWWLLSPYPGWSLSLSLWHSLHCWSSPCHYPQTTVFLPPVGSNDIFCPPLFMFFLSLLYYYFPLYLYLDEDYP